MIVGIVYQNIIHNSITILIRIGLKNIDFRKIGVIVLVIIMISISVSFILTKPVDKNNTTLITGHYKGITQVTSKGRGGGSVSYNLYITENVDFYKVAADNSDCLDYGSFGNSLKEGQPIQIYLQDSFFRRSMIVCMISNNIQYISFDCANQQIDKERIMMPIICLIITVLLIGAIYKKEIKRYLKTR